jgi:hypothetical protein
VCHGEIVRSTEELRRIVRDALLKLENAARDARAEAQHERSNAQRHQARATLLQREVAQLRKELDDSRRDELKRGRKAALAGDASAMMFDATMPTPDDVALLRKELSDARQQLVLYESRALDQASEMAAALSAATQNYTAAAKASETQTRLNALQVRHDEISADFARIQSASQMAVAQFALMAEAESRHVHAARGACLKALAAAAGATLANRVFRSWASAARERLRENRLAGLQSRADTGVRLLTSAESDLALLKHKHYKITVEMQDELDVRRLKITALTKENEELKQRVTVLGRLASGVGVPGSVAASFVLSKSLPVPGINSTDLSDVVVQTTDGDDGAASPSAATQISEQLVNLPVTDRRGAVTQSAEQQHIDALEAYNVLYRTLRACRERLQIRCVPLLPLQMHERTTVSITALVIAWIRKVATSFSRLFTLEARVTKLRTKLVCVSLSTRGRIAGLAVKLSLPIGTLEGTLVRTKKERYEELITRIASLRAKIESVRESVQRQFSPNDTTAATRLVESLEADIALFMRVLKAVEADQFNLSLQLTRVRMEREAGSFASLSKGFSLHSAVDGGAQQQPQDVVFGKPANNAVLNDSRTLVAELRSASAPLVREDSHVPGGLLSAVPRLARHGALTPLEDRVQSLSAVATVSSAAAQEKLALATGSIVTEAPTLSDVLRQRAKQERTTAGHRKGHKPFAPPTHMMGRGGAVIPFRSFTSAEGEVSKRRVRLADDLMK